MAPMNPSNWLLVLTPDECRAHPLIPTPIREAVEDDADFVLVAGPQSAWVLTYLKGTSTMPWALEKHQESTFLIGKHA